MLKFALALAALSVCSASQAAVSVNFQGGGNTLPVGATIIQDFESFANGASIGVNASVFNASVSGQAARPAFGSIGNFGAVLGEPTNGSYVINFAPTSLFSFIVGSLDTYNTLRLIFADASITPYLGGQIINDLTFPSGDQISGETNGRVTYSVVGGPLITGAIFESSRNSFEFDDLAIGAVPEPTTWAMLLAGFGLVGGLLRSRRRHSMVVSII
jgi:PEP-CTERM motif